MVGATPAAAGERFGGRGQGFQLQCRSIPRGASSSWEKIGIAECPHLSASARRGERGSEQQGSELHGGQGARVLAHRCKSETICEKWKIEKLLADINPHHLEFCTRSVSCMQRVLEGRIPPLQLQPPRGARRTYKGRMCIELFSGSGRLTRAMNDIGIPLFPPRCA